MKLVLMPLTRMQFYEPFSVGDFRFYPPGILDLKFLPPIQNKSISEIFVSEGIDHHIEGRNLREISASITGFSIDILHTSPIVAFPFEIDLDNLLCSDHNADIELIRILSAKVEKALDVIRFDFCRFDLPDTLPGLAGSWGMSGQFLGAMVCSLKDHEGCWIAGAALETSIVIRGLGLEIDSAPSTPLLDPSVSEVAGVAVHGLTLFSDVMSAFNETMKFIRAMTLLEFLASPDYYKSWAKLKGDIICHCAKDKKEYIYLSEWFKGLTSIKDNAGIQRGLKTLIVHQGRSLSELKPSRKDRQILFRELQKISGKILVDMIRCMNYSWDEFRRYHSSLKQRLGVA